MEKKEAKKKAVPRQQVECVKEGWVRKGIPVAIGERVEVTVPQAKRLQALELIKPVKA